MSRKEQKTSKKATFMGIGLVSEITAYQSFILLGFTFFFAVIGINVLLITIGFIIWSLWNALNDPLLGYISDRTHTKWGRRIPWLMISFIPLAIMMILLFFPVLFIGIENEIGNFIYFLIIIIIFELFYTMYSLNLAALFPEVFLTKEERIKGNNIKQIFTIVGLLFAFILPGIFITGSYATPDSPLQYLLFGVIASIIVIAGAVIFLIFGPRERAEFQKEFEETPSFFNSIRSCVKNKAFMWYIPAQLANWFVYGMFPTVLPLYAEFVLGIEVPMLTSVMLLLTFLSAGLFMTLVWKPVVRKLGNRKTWMISMGVWIVLLIPLLFIQEFISGMIVFFLIGIGLSGSLYIVDLILADIIDDDELKTGIRKEGAYYGVNSFFLRLSNVLVILAVGIIFGYNGWLEFDPTPGIETIIGLKILVCVLPLIALVIAILVIYKYPLDGEKLANVTEGVKKLHEEKQSKI